MGEFIKTCGIAFVAIIVVELGNTVTQNDKQKIVKVHSINHIYKEKSPSSTTSTWTTDYSNNYKIDQSDQTVRKRKNSEQIKLSEGDNDERTFTDDDDEMNDSEETLSDGASSRNISMNEEGSPEMEDLTCQSSADENESSDVLSGGTTTEQEDDEDLTFKGNKRKNIKIDEVKQCYKRRRITSLYPKDHSKYVSAKKKETNKGILSGIMSCHSCLE